MFAFEIWGKFASFRDPFTISQNISLPIPPKSAVAGMMAAILGKEEYLGDETFNDFEYSVVILNPIRKKSFSQNYINDYTSKVQTHINSLKRADHAKVAKGLRDKISPQKPINRELLIDVRYLIFVKKFDNRDRMVKHLENRICKFPLYLGNSEFAGNFRAVKIDETKMLKLASAQVDSFIRQSDVNKIEFGEGTRYATLSFATKLNVQRGPMELSSVIVANKFIDVKDMSLYRIKCEDREYYCRFV